ncbi:beta strand repeat-containing protein [Hymenobacter sp. CRA2]|uniref:beta strand repeat-containing protein n=1 Tax=Hymenobacter sp. CRA2 TaxID=1955620 RepID=UPI0009D10430|nr:LamG-like jellyroll fold domain-containing protein [Hymenobacter sp. CRA2]OON70675.1 hypothetical protein B0919_01265 [Hymenobacter sp. CRA2]
MKHNYSLTRRGLRAVCLLVAYWGLWLLPRQTMGQAPTWTAATSGNNFQSATSGTSIIQATAVNADGDVLVTGYFSGAITFGNTALTSTGSDDMFVAKWNAATSRWAWAAAGGGTGTDRGYGVAVSGTNVYVTGYFGSSSASFAGTSLTNAGGTSGSTDVFVAKFVDNGTSATGTWARGGGGTSFDQSNSIAVNGTSVYVTGQFTSGTGANFASTALAGAGSSDAFVAKYTDNGSTVTDGWAISAGGTGSDNGYGIAATSSGVYVAGQFTSATNARIAGTTLAGAGGTDLFVAKYVDSGSSAAGTWARSGGGAGTEAAYGIAVNGSNVYLTGYFNSAAGASIAGAALASSGSEDLFVAKYTDNGTSVSNGWARSGGGLGTDIGRSVAASGTGVYVTGQFASGNSASIAGTTLTGNGTSNDAFVAKYVDGGTSATNGWANSGGGIFGDQGNAIAANSTGVYAGIITGATPASFGTAPLRLAPANAGVLAPLDPATGAWRDLGLPLQGGTSVTTATATDAAGNVFVTGNFSGTVGFGNTVLASAGANDMFVAKWSAASSTWAWAQSGGGSSNDQGLGIAVNGTSVYVTGYFTSASGAVIAGASLAGAGSNDVFIAKYTDNGSSATGTWACSAGGTGNEQGNAIAATSAGVYVTGQFASGTSASFAGTTLAGAGSTDLFVAKYTDNGTSVANGWARSGGGASGDVGLGIAVNGTAVYVTGYYSYTSASSNVNIAGTTLTGAGGADVYVAKYTDNGTSVANGWATSGGGGGTDQGNGIAVNGTNVYVTGTFGSNNSFSIAGTSLPGAGSNNTDLFVVKYTDNGTSAASGWATSGGGANTPDLGNAIAVSGTSVYVTGSFFLQSFGTNIAGSSLTSAGGTDVYVAKYVDNGTSFSNGWVQRGGGTGSDAGYGIALSGTQLYVAGSVTPAATFGGTTLTQPAGAQINFLAQLPTVVVPTVTTDAAANITATGATLGGNVTADGGASVTERGVVYSTTSTTPTTADTKLALGNGLGSFSQAVTGLAANTTYYVRAYALNAAGTGYGSVQPFTTPAAPPAAPVVLTPANGSTLSTDTPTYSGTAPVNSTVAVWVDGNSLGTTTADASGNWSLTSGTTLSPGSHTVFATATVNGVSSANSTTNTFTVALLPTISSFSPDRAGAGMPITLTGTNLDGATALTINGEVAVIESNTATTITFRVPARATSTGTSSVITAAGTALSTAFTVIMPPGNALDLDGDNDYVRVPDSGALDFGAGNFTVEAWVLKKAASTGYDNGAAAGKWNTGAAPGTNEWLLNLTTSGNDDIPSFWFESGTTLYTCSATNTPLALNRWYHVAGVREGSTLYIYVNGELKNSVTIGSGPVNNVGRDLLIGALEAGYHSSLRIDEVRVWNVARTAAELQAGMKNIVALGSAGLVAYYSFDEGTPNVSNPFGLPLYNVSGNANHGNLNGFALTGTTSNWVNSYAMVVPTATGATSVTSSGATGIGFTANWTEPALGTVTGYAVEVSTTSTFATAVGGSPFTVAAPATSLAITGLPNTASTYYYRVRALNSNLAQPDQGALSNAVSTATPLPVTLVQFTAEPAGPGTVRLAWATAQEQRSAYFDVERSLNGQHFVAIGRVAAAGTSTNRRTYALHDEQLPAGASLFYYRLRQVDTDGTAAYSPLKAVRVAAAGLTLAPNPAHCATMVRGAAPGAPVQLLDALGRPVLITHADAAGTAAWQLPAGLPGGVYLVRSGSQTARLVVE